ncbi:MAG: DNA alkylation repair protein [Pyrinomonadaceae bacterium]|nr:DNA alkylation repair protein [Pyrinomonadaceae bacterium]
MHIYLKPLVQELERHANDKDAIKMKAYMKDRFEMFGIKTPARRMIAREFLLEYGLPEFRDLEKIVFACFAFPERELHHFGIELCGKFKKQWTPETVKLFERMTITKSWWDSVDSINIFCIKPYFARIPNDIYSITQAWIDSNNVWLQRLSIIFQLRLTDKTDRNILSRNILQLNDSEKFFVQKAIGWALRDLAHTDPDWVLEFVQKNELKPLSRREALKHI